MARAKSQKFLRWLDERVFDKNFKDIYHNYWTLYGGTSAIVTSPYFYFSIFFTIILFPAWAFKNAEGEFPWNGPAVEIIPSLLGFTMGGMAIFLAFFASGSMKALLQKNKPDSQFMKITSNFFHFIIVQSLALLFVVITLSYNHMLFSFIGFFLFCYGIFVAVALSGQLLRIAQIINAIPPGDGGK